MNPRHSFYYSFPSSGSTGWELSWERDSLWAAQVMSFVLYERRNGTLTEVRWSDGHENVWKYRTERDKEVGVISMMRQKPGIKETPKNQGW